MDNENGFAGSYTYKRRTFVINVNGRLFHSPGLVPLGPNIEGTLIYVEEDDNLLFLKTTLEAILQTPVYLYYQGRNITFEIKEKNQGLVQLPLVPGKNLNNIIPIVNRDIQFKRVDLTGLLLENLISEGELVLIEGVSLKDHQLTYGEDTDDNVLWAYFDNFSEITPDMRWLERQTGLKQKYNGIVVAPEITTMFSECNLLEAVIHVNYEKSTRDFIELEKLFRLFQLSEDIPIVRYRSGYAIQPYFKIYKNLVQTLSKEELKDLLDVKVASVKEKRYISFKLKNKVLRYNTVNIYADGKVDIYCSWEEKYGSRMNPGAAKGDLLNVIIDVIRLIEQIDCLHYHKAGMAEMKLMPPNTDLTGNTYVTNYNTINLIHLEKEMDFKALEAVFAEFSPYVTVISTADEEAQKISLRFKRINNYDAPENIKRFMKSAWTNVSKGDNPKKELLLKIVDTFGITQPSAERYIDDFKLDSDEEKKGSQKPSYPGVAIDITKQYNSTVLKCKFLGANNTNTGRIYKFIQKMFTYFFAGKTGKPVKIKVRKVAETSGAQGTSATASENGLKLTDQGGKERIILTANGKVNMPKAAPSLLDYLKIMGMPYVVNSDKTKTDKISYARDTCQCNKQPVVIYKQDHYDLISEELGLHDETAVPEMKLNKLAFERGQRDGVHGFFYFCPVTWDHQNIKRMDEGHAPYFPLYREVTDENPTYFKRKDEDLQLLYARNDGNGFCCYYNATKGPDTEENKLKTQSYILKANVTLTGGRFGWLPDVLNDRFNTEEGKRKAVKLIFPFEVYLRMHPGGILDEDVTECSGSSFITAMAKIGGHSVVDTLKTLYTFLRTNEWGFKSLKSGAIYTFFTPEDEFSNRQEIQAVLGYREIAEQFILYISHGKVHQINEDFLWDYFTEELGLNIIIIEAGATGIVLKCPVGYAMDKMYKGDRNTVLLFRQDKIYDIISKARFTSNASEPKYNFIFPAEDGLIRDFLTTLQKQCQTQSKAAIPPLTLSQFIAKIASLPDIQVIPLQLVDRYNKVIAVKIQVQNIPIWFPLEPSGINEEMDVKITADNLPSVQDAISACLTLDHYYGFEGYAVDHVLLHYGDDIESANEDRIIGIKLKNKLTLWTQPCLIGTFQAFPHFPIINPDTHLMEYVLNTFYDSERREEMWYADYYDYDLELAEGTLPDMRQVYVARLYFEQDTYQRFRVLLSKLLADNVEFRQQMDKLITMDIPVGEMTLNAYYRISDKGTMSTEEWTSRGAKAPVVVGDIFKYTGADQPATADGKVVPIQVSTPELQFRRGKLFALIEKQTRDSITREAAPAIINAVGPVTKGYAELKDVTYDSFKFDYRQGQRFSTDRLFIAPVNLVTGDEHNLENYIFRVIEELQRSPLKRNEIMNNILIEDDSTDFYIENITTDIDKLYAKEISIVDRMQHHIDMLKVDESDTFSYLVNLSRLPYFWRLKLQPDVFFTIDTMEKGFIYDEFDRLLKTREPQRIVISRYIKSLPYVEQHEVYQMYQQFGMDYAQETFTDEMVSNKNHELNKLDLSIISQAGHIGFLILTGEKIESVTIGYPARFMLLFKAFDMYQLVVSNNKQKIFSIEDLPVYMQRISRKLPVIPAIVLGNVLSVVSVDEAIPKLRLKRKAADVASESSMEVESSMGSSHPTSRTPVDPSAASVESSFDTEMLPKESSVEASQNIATESVTHSKSLEESVGSLEESETSVESDAPSAVSSESAPSVLSLEESVAPSVLSLEESVASSVVSPKGPGKRSLSPESTKVVVFKKKTPAPIVEPAVQEKVKTVVFKKKTI
jgi:hypothetical protein